MRTLLVAPVVMYLTALTGCSSEPDALAPSLTGEIVCSRIHGPESLGAPMAAVMMAASSDAELTAAAEDYLALADQAPTRLRAAIEAHLAALEDTYGSSNGSGDSLIKSTDALEVGCSKFDRSAK